MRFAQKLGACFVLFLSGVLIAYGQNAPLFSDVTDKTPHVFAIKTLKEAGIISGYGDGTFKPEKSVSRAEAAAIIIKGAGITAEKSAFKLPFNDVPDTAWFFPVIQKGTALGKLKGYPDKTFRPDNRVTLPEALAMTLGFFQINSSSVAVDPLIYDGLSSNEWYAKSAQYAKNMNLIEPDENGFVEAQKPLTRAQLAELVYRMRAVRSTGKTFDITSGWINEEHQDNFWKLKRPPETAWEVFKGTKNSVIWKRDSASHVFFTRLPPKGARLSLSVVENFNLDAFKNGYRTAYPGVKINVTEMTLSGRYALQIAVPEKRILDLAISLPNNNYLVLYGEYGDSARGQFLKKQLEAVIASYEYVARPPAPVIPLEQRMETLRQNILVKDGWKVVSSLFPDKKLIHTDAIGIGTGPVDYYYSKEADHTIKLERNTATILNIKTGSTNAF